MAAPAAATGTPAGFVSPSLYVGDLNQDISEALLFDIFGQIGPLTTVRVCRDSLTGRSLGYAYVNFVNADDAERALESLNYTPIKGRQCRIMWSQRDPAARKSGVGNVFIKNLDKEIDNKALHDTFSQFGAIRSCKVAMDEKGQPKGYGFVNFETEEAARTAIEKVNGMLINNKKVFVGLFQKRHERLGPDVESKFTNVFVKNLDPSVDDAKLEAMFTKYGKITSHVIMKGDDGSNRGFGFVNFENPEDAKKACEALHGSQVGDKQLWVSRAQKKSERQAELRAQFEKARLERIQKYQGVNLFVKNIDESIDDDKLRTEFSAYGGITSAKVMRDDKGESKGFGFVCYTTPEEATKAVTEMNGKMLGSKPIFVALAQRKEVRRAQLEAQHQQRIAGSRMMRMGDPNMMQGGMGYPGGPMFYNAGMPGGQRPGFNMYGNQMMGRRPWQPSGPGGMRGGYQPIPQYQMPGGMPGARVPRGGRPGGPAPQMPGQQGPAGPGPQQPGRGPVSGPVNPNGPRGPMGGMNPNAGRGPAPAGGAPANPNARMPPGQAKYPRGPAPAGQPGQANLEPLTAAGLAAAPERQQKQMIGERLYPLVLQQQPELASKITGMLLEMDNSELILLLESPDALQSKIQEAIMVLEEHQKDAH
eukprot:comp20919_c0_seq1/m.43596 comp20919_c0_seq1/g.43596  ORF comp20919_c0_seq1/g.43596 comp20919_c0_seq1/m.43596 type:complete len:646 (-) comp20919_c0_seq1:256-2193(-)